MKNARVYAMKFGRVYPLYIAKVEKKGRTKEEVDQVIHWLTGYDDSDIRRIIAEEVNFEDFFLEAPKMNENVGLITGMICGYRVEDIEDDIMQKMRYLDKLVDEIAKGRKMEKVLRTPKID